MSANHCPTCGGRPSLLLRDIEADEKRMEIEALRRERDELNGRLNAVLTAKTDANMREEGLRYDLAAMTQQRDELLALVNGFHRKLETYRNSYSGDKELRRRLSECEAAIAKVKEI
jgi:hypothetical protein